MALHQLTSVEDVFLKLCKKDHMDKHRKNGTRQLTGHDNPLCSQTDDLDADKKKSGKFSAVSHFESISGVKVDQSSGCR